MRPEDTTTSPWGRGTCRVCDRPYNLTKSGKIRAHVNTKSRIDCAGAGDWPKETP